MLPLLVLTIPFLILAGLIAFAIIFIGNRTGRSSK